MTQRIFCFYSVAMDAELKSLEQKINQVAEYCQRLRVDTRSRRLRERFAAAAAEERSVLERRLRSAGVDHIVLSTQGDWLGTLVAGLRARGGRR